MLHRRHLLALAGAAAMPLAAHAQGTEAAATAFIQRTGEALVAAINSGAPVAQKRQQLARIIEGAVDIEGVARFCLGRFWRQATPDQQKTYLALFHDFLVLNISVKLGDYQGVKFTILKTSTDTDGNQVVLTRIERPNNAPASVAWPVVNAATTPRIVDVIAEGTSLRITQRSDYAAFLQSNGNNIDALLNAIRQQTTRPA